MSDWRILHGEIIKDFLYFLNYKSNKFVLKDGTSLMMCYNLTRFLSLMMMLKICVIMI